MLQFLLVAAGGATGAVCRYSLSTTLKFLFNESFYSTLFINIIGSFFIGYLISLGYAKNLSEYFLKYFLIIGLLGSFTTFSAFSYEVLELLMLNKIFLSITYIIISVTFCILASYIGMHINKF